MDARIVNDRDSLSAMLELLKENNLPYEDLRMEDCIFVTYHDGDDNLIGSGGLEFYAKYALLRSVVVDESQRGKSLGKQIVADLVARAKANSAMDVFLLTESAQEFFVKLGFKDIARDEVPTEIKTSSQFKAVCPQSAHCMTYKFI